MDCTPGGERHDVAILEINSRVKRPEEFCRLELLAKGRRKAAIVAALTLLTLTTAGCSVVHNGFTSRCPGTTLGTIRSSCCGIDRNSAKSWHRRKQNFCNEKHSARLLQGLSGWLRSDVQWL